jgi:hypothetical protein
MSLTCTVVYRCVHGYVYISGGTASIPHVESKGTDPMDPGCRDTDPPIAWHRLVPESVRLPAVDGQSLHRARAFQLPGAENRQGADTGTGCGFCGGYSGAGINSSHPIAVATRTRSGGSNLRLEYRPGRWAEDCGCVGTGNEK